MPERPVFHLRSWFLGVMSPVLLLVALAAARPARWWPSGGRLPDVIVILDSLALHMAGLALVVAAILALLHLRVPALLLALIALGGLAELQLQKRAHGMALLPETGAAPSILWFNLLKTNPVPADDLIATLAAAPADLIILAEAGPLRGHLPELRRVFPVVQGCDTQRCELLVLSRQVPVSLSQRKLYGTRPERLVHARFALPDGQSLSVIGAHMVKPWYHGFRQVDEWYLMDEIDRSAGPLVVVGDFNAAPWSRMIRHLSARCGLVSPRSSPATWPAQLGWLGVPLDGILLRGGAGVSGVAPWGADLGSNHRGILLDVAFTPEGGAQPQPRCLPGR